MVSAELAVAVPAVLLLLGLALGLVEVAIDTVRCTDAARVGARAAARGDGGEAAARAAAPSGSEVIVSVVGRDVVVVVRGPARSATGWLPGSVQPQGRAVAALEEAP